MSELTNKALKWMLGLPAETDGKICIPISFGPQSFKIAQRFKDADTYLLIDFLYQKAEEISAQKMLTFFTGQDLRKLGLTAVICQDIFPMALKIINDNGIVSYVPTGGDIGENLHLFGQGQLIRTQNAAVQTSCLSACSSCTSICHSKN